MKNTAINEPFPINLFLDLGVEKEEVTEQSEDFLGTLMYVLRTVTSPRNSRALLLRYQNGKNFDEIGEALGVSKQRANLIVNETLGQITGDHIHMMVKGMKRYMEDMLELRIANLLEPIESARTNIIRTASYNEGYDKGYEDGIAMSKKTSYVPDVDLDTTINALGLSNRTYNACMRNTLTSIRDILDIGDAIVDCNTFGVKCFHELMQKLAELGIKVNDFFPRAIAKLGLEDEDGKAV